MVEEMAMYILAMECPMFVNVVVVFSVFCVTNALFRRKRPDINFFEKLPFCVVGTLLGILGAELIAGKIALAIYHKLFGGIISDFLYVFTSWGLTAVASSIILNIFLPLIVLAVYICKENN